MSKEELIKILSTLTQEQLAHITNMVEKLNAHSQKIGIHIRIKPCMAA